MNTNDHLARAREYIAKGDDYYAKAADEIIAAQREDPTLGYDRIAARIGRDRSWVRRLVQSRTNGERAPEGEFKVDWQSGSNKRDEVASKVLRDPVQRRQVIASLPSDVREAVIEESNEAAIADIRAKQAEHDTTPRQPTVRDLMGGERFDPSESWADTDIIRVQSKAHALARQVAKWGLVLGSLSEDEAFQMLQEAEHNIAEVRATLQERIADRSRSEV